MSKSDTLIKYDPITIERIQLLHPAVREEVSQMYEEICERLTGKAMCRFAYTLRTFAEQDELYAQGRTKDGKIVTKAKGGQSWHNYGLAFDVVLLLDKDGNGTYETASWDTKADFDNDFIADWDEIVYVAKLYGWDWGGDWVRFTDKPHFERTFGLTIAEAKKRFETGQLIPNTNYIKI